MTEPRPFHVDLFAEDRGHELFLTALVERLAREAGRTVTITVRSARGGHGKALAELKLYQLTEIRKRKALPDLLIVAIDGNCKGYAKARKEILEKIEKSLKHFTVAACPDPHIERWYLADPESFCKVVGKHPDVKQDKCERDYYKNALTSAVREAGFIPTLGGIEFAEDLIAAMDLGRAGRAHTSLGDLIESLTAKLRR